VNAIRTNIRERRGVIEAVIADGFPDWNAGMRSSPCRTPLQPIGGTFSTTWGTLSNNWYASGTSTMTLDDAPVAITRAGSRAGDLNNGRTRVQVRVETQDDLRYTFTFTMPLSRWFESYTSVGEHDLGVPPLNSTVAIHDISGANAVSLGTFDVAEGTWVFDAVGRTDGAPVAGSFLATLWARP
jgi:hypothetical protein